MKILLALLPALAASCSTPDASDSQHDVQPQSPSATTVTPKALPRLYWPLDHTQEQKQTVVLGFPQYRVTVTSICLNDSAVSNPVTLGTGPALAISHNYESNLLISKNGQRWQLTRLTKAIFQGNSTAQMLGPLSSLALSSTSFSGYKKPDFLFYTRLGVPDSDIFVEADIALRPGEGLRLINVHEPAPSEAE